MPLKSLLYRGASLLTSNAKSHEKTVESVFPTFSTDTDGETCIQDCDSCPASYGRAFDKIGLDTASPLWGGLKGYANHVVVATGESDWIRDVEEIPGSVMEALAAEKNLLVNGRLMISASNIPPPHEYYTAADEKKPAPTTVVVLPAFTVVDNVTSANVPELIQRFINPGPTTSDLLQPVGNCDDSKADGKSGDLVNFLNELQSDPVTADLKKLSVNTPALTSRPYPHDYLIMLCSHKRRDARCGISAPILKKEFERHLSAHGLWRDLNDSRAGGASVVFINHVGGHKFAANVLVYRKADGMGVWLARVAPKHVAGIVKYTILEGKVVNPDMIRGGFNRSIGATSW